MSTLGYDILNDKKKLFLDDKENNLACRLYIQVDICCIALFQVWVCPVIGLIRANDMFFPFEK